MPESNYQGGCSCGAIRYRLTAPPLVVHCCHCTWCQRESGASFALNVLIESSQLELNSGDPECVATPSNSGNPQNIFRCPTCRVAVWSHYPGFGDKVCFVRAGTLDAGHDIAPDIHIYTTTKQPWLGIPEPSVTADEFYDLKAVWPASSLKRLKVALER